MEEMSKSVKGVEGNTKTSTPNKKRISPSRRWVFTLNNYTDEQLSNLAKLSEGWKQAIIGKEVCPTTGTPHLQGYVEFKKAVRPAEHIPIKQIHWEKAKAGPKANLEYCTKESEIFINKGFSILKDPMAGLQIQPWQQKIYDIIKGEPSKRTIYWIYDQLGGIGKTTFQKHLCLKHGFITLSGKAADIRNGVLDYTNTNGSTPMKICINIPKSFSKDYVSYEGFENIKDMFFYSGKYEGGMVNGPNPHLFIFSNFAPDEGKMSADRWDIWDETPYEVS